MPADQRKPSTAALTALTNGVLTVVGQITQSSNFTFLVDVKFEGQSSQAIYKPLDGEEPLDDFPAGLYRREVAAYELAAHLGWPSVPETVVRSNGPFGVGSLQRFIPARFEEHYFVLREDEDKWAQFDDQLREVALFDMIVNNADRKGGHCLVDQDDSLWCIDHGLTFHEDPKLRTVIWDFGGDPLPAQRLDHAMRLLDHIPDSLKSLLSPAEIEALQNRIRKLAANPVFPFVVSQRQYPWPLV